MTKIDDYRAKLRSLEDWDSYLLANSGLPGPRGNLELAQAAADEGSRALFERYLTFTPDRAPVNSPYEFLAFCGVVGLGRLLAGGEPGLLPDPARLRLLTRAGACAKRWPWRCSAWAMPICPACWPPSARWSRGHPLEQRAAAAALCEPRLLRHPEHARAVLQVLDEITARSWPLRTAAPRISSPCARAWATAGAWRLPPCPPRASRSWKSGWPTRIRISAGSCWKT